MTSPWNRIAFETGTCQSFFLFAFTLLSRLTHAFWNNCRNHSRSVKQQKRSERRDREDRAVARQLETAEDRVLEA